MIRFILLLFFSGCIALNITELDTGYLIVDTESYSGFVTSVRTTDGSIASLIYGDTEYQYASTFSHVASGLGALEVSYKVLDNHAIISVVSNTEWFNLTHYYVFADAEDRIYIGTYINAEPSVGELRYIARLTGLPNAHKNGIVSEISGGSVIEGGDVYLVGEETRCKFYSSERFIDTDTYCAYNNAGDVYACWVASNMQAFEKSSGGPFFRDINLNNVGTYHSLTYYMNSGHVQTEAYRMGFYGPYTLTFGSSPPVVSEIDVSFFEHLGLTGYTPASGRGFVHGTASGTSSNFDTVLHWYNNEYQFWTTAETDRSFTSPAMVEGSYTMALYQGELLAATGTISITAEATTTVTISATNPIITQSRTTIFQIGEYDGKPEGLLNADLQLRMHPSDQRMSNWTIGEFNADTQSSSEFPMALFMDVNSPQIISFTLDEVVTQAVTIRVASTLSYAGARASVSVNGVGCGNPSAPVGINSRGVTRGAYRGRGTVWECTVAAGTLTAGKNTVSIYVVSGSGGSAWLSPNFIIDAIELFY